VPVTPAPAFARDVPPQRIAVVGAGLAGLAAAWWLGRRHGVTVFERLAAPGFTARSVSLAWRGEVHRVDVPLRVFYPGYYPTLGRLYRELQVPSEPVSYAASFHGPAFGGGQRPYFRYRNLRIADQAVGVLAPQDLWLGPAVRPIVGGLLRFARRARRALEAGALEGLTIEEHLQRERYPQAFVRGFLLPAIATVCTCTFAQARRFPAAVVVDYLARGVARQSVRRALLGADDVQQRLLAGIADLRCDARIAAVRRVAGGVELQAEDGSVQGFDHVVFATAAHHARRLLADASAEEASVLESFGYSAVDVVTHRDPRLLPPRRGDWSPVNVYLDEAHDVPESTIWINAVQPRLRHAEPVFQTVHPLREPLPHLVMGRAAFERPVVSPASERALPRLAQWHAEPGRRTWFCGSWAEAGIPLLESAVRSAAQVAQRLGAAAAP